MLKKILLTIALVIAYKKLVAQPEAPATTAAQATSPWELGTPTPLMNFINGENEPNRTIAINQDGSIVAALNQNGEVKVVRWHQATGWERPKELNTKKNDGFLASDIAMNKDGSLIFIAAIRGPVNVLQYDEASKSWQKHKIINTLDRANTSGIETNEVGDTLFINVGDNLYQIDYNPKTKRAASKKSIIDFSLLRTIYTTKNVRANGFDINDAGTVIAIGHEVGLVGVAHFNGRTDSWEIPLTAIEIPHPIQKVAISGDGSAVAAASKDGTVLVSNFDLKANHWTPQVTITKMNGPLSLLKLNTDGTLLTIGSDKGTIQNFVCQPAKGQCQAPITLFSIPENVKVMAINSAETRVFTSSSDDSDIKVFYKK